MTEINKLEPVAINGLTYAGMVSSHVQCVQAFLFSNTEIERRSRPLEDNTTDPGHNHRSSSGFLGQEESFEDCLRKDSVL